MGNAINGTSGNVDVLIIGGGPTGIGAAYRYVYKIKKVYQIFTFSSP